MSRKLFFFIAACTLVGLGLSVNAGKALAASTPSGGECQLAGTANLSPGLSSTSQSFTYNFSGNLTGCQSNDNAPATGTVSAGQTLNGNQEPVPTGTGSCANSSTSGTAFIAWADGDYTVIQYTTSGAGAGVDLSGTVIASATVVDNSTTPPTDVTIATNEPSTPVGSSALGQLTFSTASPTGAAGCAPGGTGVSQASINGATEIGQS